MGHPAPSAEASLFRREAAPRYAASASPRSGVESRLASGTLMMPCIPSAPRRPGGEASQDRRAEAQAAHESAPARTRSLERNFHMQTANEMLLRVVRQMPLEEVPTHQYPPNRLAETQADYVSAPVRTRSLERNFHAQTANEMLLRAVRQMPLEGMHLNSSCDRRQSSSQDQRLDPIDALPKSGGCPGFCKLPHVASRPSELPTPGTSDSYRNELPPIVSGDQGITTNVLVRAPSPSTCVITSSTSKSEWPTHCHGEGEAPGSPRSPSLVSLPELHLTPGPLDPGSPDSANSPSILLLNPQTPPPRVRPSTRRCTGPEVQKAVNEIERQTSRSASRARSCSSTRLPSPEVQQLLSTLDGRALEQLAPTKHDPPVHARQSSRRIARGGA